MNRFWMNAPLLVGLALAVTAVPAWAEDFDKTWEQLGDKAPETSEAARKIFANAGDKGVKFIAAKLAADVNVDEVMKIVADLEADGFKEREAASKKLLTLGKNAQPLLEKLLGATKNQEVATRLEAAIAKLNTLRRPDEAEVQRQSKGVELLEAFGEKDGKAALVFLEEVRVRTPWDFTRSAASGAIDRIRGRAFDATISKLQADAAKGKDIKAELDALKKKVAEAGLADDEGIAFKIGRAELIAQTYVRVQDLRNQLKTNDQASIRNELARLLFGVLDDPAGAAAVIDEKSGLGKGIALAAKDRSTLSTTDRLTLAQFYTTQGRAGVVRPELMFTNAIELLRAVLKDQTLDDRQRQLATAMLTDAQDALADAAAAAAGWSVVSALADINKHVGAGDWTKNKTALTLKSSDFGLINIPVAPEGSYEMRVKLTRTQGSDGIFIAVPVGTSRACLNIGGWNNTISTLENVGMHSGDNFTDENLGRQEGIDNNKAYEYVVRIQQLPDEKIRIEVTENGKRFAFYEGPPRTLSTHGIWRMADRLNFAVGAHKSDVVFHYIRVKPIDGGKLNRLPDLEATKAPAKVVEEAVPQDAPAN